MAKKSTATESVTPKSKKISRSTAAAYAIRGMTGVGEFTGDGLARTADELYVASGGTSNIVKAKDAVNDILKVAVDLGVVGKVEVHTTTISRIVP